MNREFKEFLEPGTPKLFSKLAEIDIYYNKKIGIFFNLRTANVPGMHPIVFESGHGVDSIENAAAPTEEIHVERMTSFSRSNREHSFYGSKINIFFYPYQRAR